MKRFLSTRRLFSHQKRHFSYKSVQWDENNVAHSIFPSVDLAIPKRLRFTEFVCQDFDKFGDKLAIVDGITRDERTFKDLLLDTNTIGTHLRNDFDISKGDTIALVSPNHVDFFSCLHGAAKLGATVTPVNPSFSAPEIAKQLIGSNSKMVIAHTDCLEACKEGARLAMPELGHECPVISIDQTVQELRERKVDELLPPTPLDDCKSTLYLPYSSGTTGLPKGVCLSHENLVVNVLQSEEVELKFMDDNDVTLSPLPMFHIYGFLASLHNPLVKGTTMITMKRFDLERFCELVQEHKVTRMHVVPPILLALSKSPVVDNFDFSSLRVGVSAAAPLYPELEEAVSQRLGCVVKQLWGMSELSPLGTGNKDDQVKSGFVGPPVSNTQAKIVDIQTGENLGPNQEGELCIRGPQVMVGYLNAPDKTAECLMEDGWLHTGDVAYIDEDGFVKITDRIKELIKYKGFQVAPAELEDVLLSLPAVLDACVIGKPDDVAGELPRAYVVLKPEFEGNTTEQDIADQVANVVTKYKRLTGGVVFTDTIPKTASGKLLRREVVALDKKLSESER